MNEPTLLTIGHFFPDRTVVIWEGEKEIAAVFGNPKEANERAAELVTGANLLRQLRASRVNVTITKGRVKQ